MERQVFYPTEEGTPQGGIISAVLANMALDGLEQVLHTAQPKTTRSGRQAQINLVRYADDFIVTGSSREVLETQVKPLIEDYVSGPNRVHDNKNRDAKQFTDSIQDSLTHKLDFGGHFGNIHDRAMPTSRDAIVDLKEDTCADGRINIGRVNEAVIDGKMKIEFELKDECKVIPVMGNAHVPTNDISHPGIEVRTINTEALNPRLSGDLKITNDLYPWV